MAIAAIELKNITKRFGKVVANNNVCLSAYKGEILSLLGENGSGKTTLMNMISGIYYPDEGQILIDGNEVVIRSPKDAFDHKIGMIHQHFKLIDVFNSTQNIVLGLEGEKHFSFKAAAKKTVLAVSRIPKNILRFFKSLVKTVKRIPRFPYFVAKFFKSAAKAVCSFFKSPEYAWHCLKTAAKTISEAYQTIMCPGYLKRAEKAVLEISKQYGFDLDPNKKIYEMSVSEKQTVEIIKVLYRGADILILDEPTAVLTPQETQKLFAVLRNMRDDGKAIIIITHKLHEVLSLSDKVAVLRKGEYIGTVNTAETNEAELTEMMVGKKISLNINRSEPKDPVDRLEVKNLCFVDSQGVKKLDNISFTAKSGEILGIAGIAGSGQRELLESIAGLQHVQSGEIIYHNPKTGEEDELCGKSPIKIRELGVRLSFVPEDRLGMGLVGNMDIVDNMMLRSYRKGKSMFLERKKPRNLAERIIKDLEVVTPSAQTPVRKLSGGNVQKVLVGREIASSPTVLMAAYPVRGLDINSSYAIYNLLNQQKESGVAVIFVGEDLDVLIELCDRILVISSGCVTGIVEGRGADKSEIGFMMTKANGGFSDGEQ